MNTRKLKSISWVLVSIFLTTAHSFSANADYWPGRLRKIPATPLTHNGPTSWKSALVEPMLQILFPTKLIAFCLAIALPHLAFAACYSETPARSSFAQNPANGLGCFIDEENFYVHGAIGFEDSEELERAIATHLRLKRVVLSSPGGTYAAGVRLGQVIAKYKLETLVPLATNYCASSCTYAFQSGTKRTAHPQARFLYHGVVLGGALLGRIFQVQCPGPELSVECKNQMEEMHISALIASHQIFTNLEKLGVNPRLALRYFSQAEDPDWLAKGEFTKLPALLLSAEEALALGITQEITSAAWVL